MKVLHVITSLGVGGAERLVTQIVPSLIKKGHTTDLMLFNGVESVLSSQFQKECQKLKEEGYHYPTIYKLGNSYYNPLYIAKLHHIMKQYDIIHTHNSSPQLFAAIANIGLHRRLITTEHNTTNRKRDSLIGRYLDAFMYHRYDKVICISPETEKNLLEYIKLDKNKVTTVYNGIDVNYFQKANPINIDKEGKFVLAMVAGFRSQKDQDTIIKALKHLPKEIILWLVGDGERRAQLEDLVKKLDLKKRVIFWGIRSDVANIMHSADVVIMSSHWEGFGLSAVEGMACSKPVIASDVSGLREIVKGYGLLFEKGNYKDLASMTMLLYNDKEYYKEISDRCYQRAHEFDINKMIDDYEQVYKDVFKKKI